MALAPLATIADLTAMGVTIDPAEEATLGTFLTVASAAVRDAAGTAISSTVSTVTVEGGGSQWLTLPGAPVTAVQAVALDGVPLTDWKLSSGRLWRSQGWSGYAGPSAVSVSYTHGLPEVPADIINLVCRIALAGMEAARVSPDGSGLAAGDKQQERIGDYFVIYGADGGVTEMELPPYLRARLAARFGNGVGLVRFR